MHLTPATHLSFITFPEQTRRSKPPGTANYAAGPDSNLCQLFSWRLTVFLAAVRSDRGDFLLAFLSGPVRIVLVVFVGPEVVSAVPCVGNAPTSNSRRVATHSYSRRTKLTQFTYNIIHNCSYPCTFPGAVRTGTRPQSGCSSGSCSRWPFCCWSTRTRPCPACRRSWTTWGLPVGPRWPLRNRFCTRDEPRTRCPESTRQSASSAGSLRPFRVCPDRSCSSGTRSVVPFRQRTQCAPVLTHSFWTDLRVRRNYRKNSTAHDRNFSDTFVFIYICLPCFYAPVHRYLRIYTFFDFRKTTHFYGLYNKNQAKKKNGEKIGWNWVLKPHVNLYVQR